MAPDYTAAELMTVAIARQLRDGETIAVGSVSPIPAGACLLAKETHAPRARLILLGSREDFPFNGGMQEFYNFAMRGKIVPTTADAEDEPWPVRDASGTKVSRTCSGSLGTKSLPLSRL